MTSRILGPLQERGFLLFIIGHFLSFTGSWIQTTALHWLIYSMRFSTADLGLFVFLTSFPSIFVTLIAGFIIDQLSRKKLLQVLILFSMVPPLLIFFIVYFEKQTFELLLLLSFFSSVFSSIDMPLRQVFISEIVSSKYLTQALSLQAFSFNSARMLGPALAGFIIDHIALSFCFLVNFFSFIPLFLFTFFIKYATSFKRSTGKFELREEVLRFLSFLKKEKKIPVILLLISSFTFLATSVLILLPLLTLQVLRGSAKDFALLSSATGVGALVGALTGFFRRERLTDMGQLMLAHIFWIFGMIGLIFGDSFPIYFMSMFFVGMSFTNFYPVANGLLQKHTPQELRGKVMSLFSVAFLGMAPLGQMFVGFLAEYISIKVLLLILVVVFTIINTIILRSLSKAYGH
ncbi:MAG: MFS transporter [Caldimicrobium sp.]|nr:MFS transporter [Caldimicrobium sp.]MCX7873882.1 MFS transporter [Caldimicrobium sp.]MDW8094834.1 MFS transporter [Caldimicrobium sp.]